MILIEMFTYSLNSNLFYFFLNIIIYIIDNFALLLLNIK